METPTKNIDKSKSQIKSRERVANHGEVFTAEREVKAMCDLVKDETERIESRFLEPACGDGNFLAEIINRKLIVVSKQYSKNPDDWEKYSVLAISSIYGIDILSDNAQVCRNRLFEIWNKEYLKNCGKKLSEERKSETERTVRFLLDRNILCGNALSLKDFRKNKKSYDLV